MLYNLSYIDQNISQRFGLEQFVALYIKMEGVF
jgi:hypothetical protein